MKLRHLGLPVADSQRSLAFYASYFGFDPATATRYPDGTSDPAPHAGFLHFGFGVPDAGQVHSLRERMQADGVSIVERDDEPDLVSFKCLDPDGWRIEIYWEGP